MKLAIVLAFVRFNFRVIVGSVVFLLVSYPIGLIAVVNCSWSIRFQDFQGFLNNLQDWELSLKHGDKKMKPPASDKVNYIFYLKFDACQCVTNWKA